MLKCIHRPHPQWTLAHTAAVVYEHAGVDKKIKVPSDGKELERLRQMHALLQVEELGEFEWKTPLRAFLESSAANRLVPQLRSAFCFIYYI